MCFFLLSLLYYLCNKFRYGVRRVEHKLERAFLSGLGEFWIEPRAWRLYSIRSVSRRSRIPAWLACSFMPTLHSSKDVLLPVMGWHCGKKGREREGRKRDRKNGRKIHWEREREKDRE